MGLHTWPQGHLSGFLHMGETPPRFHTHWIACQLLDTHCPHTDIWVTIRRTGFPALPARSLHMTFMDLLSNSANTCLLFTITGTVYMYTEWLPTTTPMAPKVPPTPPPLALITAVSFWTLTPLIPGITWEGLSADYKCKNDECFLVQSDTEQVAGFLHPFAMCPVNRQLKHSLWALATCRQSQGRISLNLVHSNTHSVYQYTEHTVPRLTEMIPHP